MMLKSGGDNIYMYPYNGTSCRLSWLMMYENHLCLLSQHGQLVYALRWRLCWIPHGVGTLRSSCQASQWACPPWTRNLTNSLTASMRILHSRLSTLLHSRGAYTVMILVKWHRKYLWQSQVEIEHYSVAYFDRHYHVWCAVVQNFC